MELQKLQQTYLDHLLGAGVHQERAELLLQGLSQEQLQLICQVLPAEEPERKTSL
jgi:response regulator of citrate/malate metabolism